MLSVAGLPLESHQLIRAKQGGRCCFAGRITLADTHLQQCRGQPWWTDYAPKLPPPCGSQLPQWLLAAMGEHLLTVQDEIQLL